VVQWRPRNSVNPVLSASDHADECDSCLKIMSGFYYTCHWVAIILGAAEDKFEMKVVRCPYQNQSGPLSFVININIARHIRVTTPGKMIF
jgi:hypothetical protein